MDHESGLLNISNIIERRAAGARRTFLQFLYNPAAESRPAFLIGCGRSGTSMIVHQLAKSWQVALFNENHPAAFVDFHLKALQDIEELVAQSRAPVTLFKPIHNTSQANELLARFRDARLLFVFRHYHDVINSSLRRFRNENRLEHVNGWIRDDFAQFDFARPPQTTRDYVRSRWHPELSCEDGAALYWLFYNRLYLDLGLSKNERVRLLHYESVVLDPKVKMRQIAEFLNLTFEKEMSAGIFATSVCKEARPPLQEELRTDCEELYCQLLSLAESRAGT